jgi:hypothetical protein
MAGMLMTDAQRIVLKYFAAATADPLQAAAETRRIADHLINGLRVRGFCRVTVSTSALRAAGAF